MRSRPIAAGHGTARRRAGRGRGSGAGASAGTRRNHPRATPMSGRVTRVTHSPVGWSVMPAIRTRRISRSMTKKTWKRVRPRSVHASTVKKSAAAIASHGARRKVLHGMCRCGAGPRPCSFRMRRTVDRLMRCPRLAGAGVIAMRENPPESVRDPCAACGAWRKARGPFRFRRRRVQPFLARGEGTAHGRPGRRGPRWVVIPRGAAGRRGAVRVLAMVWINPVSVPG